MLIPANHGGLGSPEPGGPGLSGCPALFKRWFRGAQSVRSEGRSRERETLPLRPLQRKVST